MEMQVNTQLIRNEREQRAWGQAHLADVSGLGLRTVQRIEATGRASYESASAIAAAFSISVADLRIEDSNDVIQPHAVAEKKAWMAMRRLVLPLGIGIAASVLAASVVFLVNGPAVNPEVGTSQRLCLYAGESFSVGSRKRVMRVVTDGSEVRMVEIPDGPVLSCTRQDERVRWVVLDPPA